MQSEEKYAGIIAIIQDPKLLHWKTQKKSTNKCRVTFFRVSDTNPKKLILKCDYDLSISAEKFGELYTTAFQEACQSENNQSNKEGP